LKTIAITSRIVLDDKTLELRDALDIRWTELFSTLGYAQLTLPSALVNVEEYLSRFGVSGVILSGGNSLASCGGGELGARRDRFEAKVLEAAIDMGIPVLGVCRGAQFVSEYFGGKGAPVAGHVRTSHNVNVVNSRFGVKGGYKNSFHDFGIIDSGTLVACAKSDDGQIEAVEHPDMPIVGIMWHPERNNPFDDLDIEFINNFFAQKA